MHDKKHGVRGEDDSIILSGMLVNIIEESMRIFWKFLRKDERNVILKDLQETQVDHKDLELLMDIRKDLQKVRFLQIMIEYDFFWNNLIITYHFCVIFAEGEKA